MSRLPIRLRVTAAFAGVMAVLLAGLGAFIYLRYESQLTGTIDQGLRSRADEVRAISGASSPAFDAADEDPLSESDESFTQILSASGTVLDSTSQIGDATVVDGDLLQRAREGTVFFQTGPPPGIEGEVRAVATPADDGERVIVVGASLDDREEALGNLAALLFGGGLVALVLASLAGYLGIGAALRPVDEMRRRAADISAAELHERLPVPAAADEISRLGETLNEMLARLEAGIERERTFIADASHELRTPLALLQTEFELALRYETGPEEMRAAVESGYEEVQRLSRLAEDLLVVARSDRGRLSIDLERLDVAALAAEAVGRSGPRFAAAGRDLKLERSGPVYVDGDRLRLGQVLTNLIDNALRHGGGDVTVGVEGGDGFARISVADRGDGFPSDFLPRAFERFTRADPARGRGGSGLGLSIVETIAVAHGGEAGARNRAGGGAETWVLIPLAGSPSPQAR